MLWIAMMSNAHAGFSAGALASAAVPISADSDSSPGSELGLWLGWRVSVGPIHVRPEVQGLLNNASSVGNVAVGGNVTFLGPVHVGPYVHMGLGLGDGGKPTTDLGLVAEFTPGPLLVGLRLGWENLPGADIDCHSLNGACGAPSDHWLTAGLEVGLK